MEYHIYVAEEDKPRFIATLEDLYKHISFNYKIVNYTLELTYSYKISFTITCSEESLKKILYYSSIKNIVDICNSIEYIWEYIYTKIIIFRSLELGEITIEYNANTRDKLSEMLSKCNIVGMYSSDCYLYSIIYNNAYMIIRSINKNWYMYYRSVII